MTRRLALLVLFAVVACRTGRPDGEPVAPLVATTPEAAMQELQARRASFRGMRSLMRVRATTGGKTQSFRAQLAVHDAQRMELVAYTPMGTTALKLKANGNDVASDPEIAPEAFAFMRETELTPAELGMLLLGLPPNAGVRLDFAATGLVSASAGDLTAQFDPPSFPAKRVVVTAGGDRIEIEHVEVVREN